ncbi:MAG: hypothetical protein GXY86_09345 [Firmicutes bacterium]|nr:hypothetical protein [Bacillota bacterium]
MITQPKLFKISAIIFLTIIFAVVGQFAVLAEETEKVESVEVQLNVGTSIYDGLRERMEFSIGRTAEKILLSRPVSILKLNRSSVETAIFNVFSKVLIGFDLDRVDLFPGKHSKVIVQLNPSAPYVGEINVNFEIEGVSPEIYELSQDITELLERELSRIFIGLPVDSISWSEGIINQVVHYLVEKEFPGYDCRFTLDPGIKTEFLITLKPVSQVIKGVKVNHYSSTIPVWFVKQKAKVYQEHFDIIKGLPVEFLKHYQARLEKYLTEYINGLPEMNRARFKVDLGIQADETTRIRVVTDSEVLRTKLEARYLISNEDDFGYYQLYLGYQTENFEIYTRYCPEDYPGGRLMAGYRWPLSTTLTAALEYEFDNYYKTLWLHNQFDRGDYFDLRIGIDGSPNEAVIGIALNDHLNLELVAYEDEFGVQFMFHF